MDVDPVVVGLLSVIGAGMIFAVLMVTLLCTLCNKCSSRDGRSSSKSHDMSECGHTRNLVKCDEVKGTRPTISSRTQCKVDTRTLKDSVLYMEAPPTYHMATEYPRVYSGQYYIGMGQSNDSELQPWVSWDVDHLEDERPPDYHLVAPY